MRNNIYPRFVKNDVIVRGSWGKWEAPPHFRLRGNDDMESGSDAMESGSDAMEIGYDGNGFFSSLDN